VSVVCQSVGYGCRANVSVLCQWSVGLLVSSEVHAQRSVLERHAYTIIGRAHHFVGRCGRSSSEVAYSSQRMAHVIWDWGRFRVA
jgi:hypothetical protein